MLKTIPLSALTAADLMSEDLLLIPQDMSLKGAARLLAANRVSGAPVVDSHNRCIGVISATDFLRWATKNECGCASMTPICQPWEIVEPESLPTDRVRNYMTSDPVIVGPEASVGEVARKMIDAHIHRLIVVEQDGHPKGIISCTDVLAAVAYADLGGRDSSSEMTPRYPHSLVP